MDNISFSTPTWIVNRCLDLGTKSASSETDYDFKGKYDFDWEAIKDLEEIGPGPLLGVDSEEDKMLIWLE